MYFGDDRDVAEPLPPDTQETNNRGELRAPLAALQGHVQGTLSLICPDSTYVVDGMVGRANKWRCHNWQTQWGPAQHVDLWSPVPQLLDVIEPEVQW